MQIEKFGGQLLHLWGVHTEKGLITQKRYDLDNFWHQIFQKRAHFIIKRAMEQVKSPRYGQMNK